MISFGQTTQNLAAVQDHLTDYNKYVNELIKTSKDLKTQNDKLKAEVSKHKKEVANANTASLAYKKKLEDLKAEQQKLLEAANAKGYQEGIADATQHYTAQVEKL